MGTSTENLIPAIFHTDMYIKILHVHLYTHVRVYSRGTVVPLLTVYLIKTRKKMNTWKDQSNLFARSHAMNQWQRTTYDC